MSFSFFKARPKTPQEVARATKESLMALDTPTVAEVKALEKVFIPLNPPFGSASDIIFWVYLNYMKDLTFNRFFGVQFSV